MGLAVAIVHSPFKIAFRLINCCARVFLLINRSLGAGMKAVWQIGFEKVCRSTEIYVSSAWS